MIIYSANDRQSFKVAEEILGYLWRFGYTKSKSMILVANKVDLERSRVISTEGKLKGVRIHAPWTVAPWTIAPWTVEPLLFIRTVAS